MCGRLMLGDISRDVGGTKRGSRWVAISRDVGVSLELREAVCEV